VRVPFADMTLAAIPEASPTTIAVDERHPPTAYTALNGAERNR